MSSSERKICRRCYDYRYVDDDGFCTECAKHVIKTFGKSSTPKDPEEETARHLRKLKSKLKRFLKRL